MKYTFNTGARVLALVAGIALMASAVRAVSEPDTVRLLLACLAMVIYMSGRSG